ncbi:MAG TPA: organomercurial lyase MerB [Anaerolineae bacterium]
MQSENLEELARDLSTAIWHYHCAEQVGRALNRMALCRVIIPLLAEGRPVSPEDVATAAGSPLDEITAVINQHMNVEYDEDGRIAGAGLTLRPTRHKVLVDGRTLYTWCALDALMYLPLLERPVQVESLCAATATPVRMTVTPQGVEDLDTPTAVMSVLKPQKGSSVRQAFCNHVNFFRSAEVAAPWLAQQHEALILPVNDAYELGKQLAQQCC